MSTDPTHRARTELSQPEPSPGGKRGIRKWAKRLILGDLVFTVLVVGVFLAVRGPFVRKVDPAIYQEGHNPFLEASGPTCIGMPVNSKTLVYSVDSSSAMGDSLDTVRSAIVKSLRTLREAQRFGLVLWSESAPKILPLSDNNPSNREAAIAQLDGLQPRGSSDAAAGIRAAVGLKPKVICIIAAKGPPQVEADAIAEECRKAGIIVHALAIRDDAPALERLASKTRGSYQVVDPRDLKTWLNEAQ